MKPQAIQYVALDVHQATLVVSVRDEQGSIVMRATVATEAKVIVGLVRGLGARVHIAFEEGTQAQWLHDVLQPHVERVIVCNTRSSGAGRAVQRILRRVRRSWRARGDGEIDAGAEDRSDRAAPVEDRRGLGCDEAECASDIALGCGDDVG